MNLRDKFYNTFAFGNEDNSLLGIIEHTFTQVERNWHPRTWYIN